MWPMDPPEAGTIVAGKYRVERELGSGGMGIVLEVTHIALERRVALKLLNANHAARPEILTRFLREARIAAMLPSEHIVRVNDVGQTENGTAYMVMELLTGHDLSAELMRRGRLPVAESVDLILQACEGLADAHAVGLVHRDLKPANLFLDQREGRSPVLKVLDFGLSKEPPGGDRKSLTTTGSVFGTPQYMSPEQIKSAKNVDARSDQHALGMILYELVTGALAYDGESVTELLVAIATLPPPHASALCPDVPLALDAAILQALAKHPDERFPNLAAFATAIAPYGGPLAQSREQRVRSALLAKVASASAQAEPAPLVSASAQGTAVPLDVMSGPTPPVAPPKDLTSSAKPMKRARLAQQIAVLSVMVLLGAGVVVIILLLFGLPGEQGAATPAPDVTASTATVAPPPAPASR